MNKKVHKTQLVMADFETTTNPNQIRKEKGARIWLGYAKHYSTDKDLYFMDIDTFIEWLLTLDCGKAKRSIETDELTKKGNKKRKTIIVELKPVVYFHNLKFDGSYIVNWIYKKYGDKSSYLIEDYKYSKGKLYSFSFKGIEFRDSLKLLSGSVKSMAGYNKEYADNYDYSKERYEKTLDDVSPNDLAYVKEDVDIVLNELLKIYFKEDSFPYLTAGSYSKAQYTKWRKAKGYDKLHPILSYEYLDELYYFYRGGLTTLNEEYKGEVVDNVYSADINSSYPHSMIGELPVGYPIRKATIKENLFIKDKITFITLRINAKLKEGYHPIMLAYEPTNPPKLIPGFVKEDTNVLIFTTDIELKEYMEVYDIEIIKIENIIAFRKSDIAFKEYYLHWYEIKRNAPKNSAERATAKVILNSLYGKFGEKYIKEEKSIIGYTENGAIQLDDGVNKISRTRPYLPVAVYTTAKSRVELYKAIRYNTDNFIYCDTDSIYIKGNDFKYITIDKDKTGNLSAPDGSYYWDIEQEGVTFKTIKRKQYAYYGGKSGYTIDKPKITCGGLRYDVRNKIHFNDFKNGTVIHNGKLEPTDAYGAMLLILKPLTLGGK